MRVSKAPEERKQEILRTAMSGCIPRKKCGRCYRIISRMCNGSGFPRPAIFCREPSGNEAQFFRTDLFAYAGTAFERTEMGASVRSGKASASQPSKRVSGCQPSGSVGID